MLSEYAVEPAAIGADWETFRYLIEKFGADKGRLISRLPNKWERKVIQTAKAAGVPDIRMASIVERLHRSKHAVVDFNRTYNPAESWIDNTVREHRERPFRAIICSDQAISCAEAIIPDDCSDESRLFHSPISRGVTRTADEISDALLLLAAAASEIDIVDPYFDLRVARGDFVSPLGALLQKLVAIVPDPKVIRVHFRSHDSRPPPEILARDAPAQTNGLLPADFCLELYEWEEFQNGEDFHDRFFLTDIGGVMIGAGLSAEGPTETATFTLLDLQHAQRVRSRFSMDSTTYRMVGPVVRIYSDGLVEVI